MLAGRFTNWGGAGEGDGRERLVKGFGFIKDVILTYTALWCWTKKILCRSFRVSSAKRVYSVKYINKANLYLATFNFFLKYV
jgi:hypothetical protein